MLPVLKSVKWHTYNGVAHPVGDTYEAENSADLAAITMQGFAVPLADLVEREPGGGAAPVLTALVPATAAIGVPSFTLRVQGSGFVPGDVIVFNGYDEPTTFVSSTELTTGVNMAVWTAPSAPLPVHVRAGVVDSNALTFTFTQA